MEVKGDLNIDGTLTVNNSPVTGGSGLSNVVEDLTPQLGGDLDTNGHSIVTEDVTSTTIPNSISLTGGDADIRSGATVNLTGGNSNTGSGGDINFASGSSTDGDGGSVVVFAGNSTNANGGVVLIGGGTGGLTNGGVEIAANGGHINLAAATTQIFSSAPVDFLGSGVANPGLITGVTNPVSAQDAATKSYVDSATANLSSPDDFSLSAANSITLLAGTDGSGGPTDFIQIQTDLAFYLGRDSGGIGIVVGESTSGNGGSINISAGLAVNAGNGGTVTIAGGDTNSGTAGAVVITPGTSVLGAQAGVTIGAGDALAGHTIHLLDPVNMHSNLISSMAEPVSAQDAATKNYVDTHTSAGGGGFYGIVWSDGIRTVRTDRLSFNNLEFYLDGRKPTLNIKESGIDHNLLANLTVGDAHTQYIRVDGTRAFTGSQSMGGNRITSLGAPQAASDAARLQDVNNGFYGIFIRESDGNPPTAKKDTIIFDSAAFYINSDSKGIPMVSFRGNVTGGVTVSDDVHTIANKTNLKFASNNFYLTQTAQGDPMVNLRYDKDLYPIYIDFPTTQQVAVDTWAQYPYIIEKVDFDCFSGSATGGFYIIRAANRATARDGIQVTTLDPLPISTTPTTRFATGNNSVNPGDIVQFSLYQNSSARRVRIMLTCKKPT